MNYFHIWFINLCLDISLFILFSILKNLYKFQFFIIFTISYAGLGKHETMKKNVLLLWLKVNTGVEN